MSLLKWIVDICGALIQIYGQSYLILQMVLRSCLQILLYFRSDASAWARTPFIVLVAQSSHKPSLVSQLKWIYWCFGLEAAQTVRGYQWILSACGTFQMDPCKKCIVPWERCLWHFMLSSFCKHSAFYWKQLDLHQSQRDYGVCWSCSDSYRCQRWSAKELFPLKVQNGCAKKTAF